MAMRLVPVCVVAAGLTAAISSCKTTGASGLKDDTPGAGDSAEAASTGGPHLCAAIRGNGNLIFAHWGAMARILETYGMIDATAGGSSGSITQFLYESIAANPDLRKCASGACSPEETGARASLLFKSLQGYVNYLGNTEEGQAIQQLLPVANRLEAQGIDDASDFTNPQVQQAVLTILKSNDIKSLVNPELVGLIKPSIGPDGQPVKPEHGPVMPQPDIAYGAKQAELSIKSLGVWSTGDKMMFVRPGLVDFDALARKIGRMGSFLAEYGPADATAMQAFLNGCAMPGRGKEWTDVAQIQAGGSTCGAMFNAMLDKYRKTLLANEASFPSRVDDPIGKYVPMIVSTSVVNGAAAMAKFEDWRRQWLAGGTPALNFDFDNDLKFGYWGRDQDLALIQSNPRGYTDPKTAKFLALGDVPWSVAMTYSPAEPSLARILEMTDTTASAGSWSDLHPTLVLKNLGCQSVIYVTRQGDESTFATGVAQQLGMTDQGVKEFYSLDAPPAGGQPSSFLKSIMEADVVWCTNWNAFDTPQIVQMTADSYNAPAEARGNAPSQLVAYSNTKANVNLRGCTPGAPPAPATP